MRRPGLNLAPGVSEVSLLQDLLSEAHISQEELTRAIEPAPRYETFDIRKSNGQKRQIHSPSPPLKLVQQKLLAWFYNRVRLPDYLHGGLPGRSIITNASRHLRRPLVVTMDIADFFPSIKEERIRQLLRLLRITGECVGPIVTMVTWNGCLPQGAATSSFLANYSFCEGDWLARKVVSSTSQEATYTRFVDDITISGPKCIKGIEYEIAEAVRELGFELAPGKTKTMPQHDRQVVTGLVVNRKLRPTKEFTRNLSLQLRDCLKFGREVVASEESVTPGKLKEQLNGRIAFLRRFETETAEKFRRLMFRIWT